MILRKRGRAICSMFIVVFGIVTLLYISEPGREIDDSFSNIFRSVYGSFSENSDMTLMNDGGTYGAERSHMSGDSGAASSTARHKMKYPSTRTGSTFGTELKHSSTNRANGFASGIKYLPQRQPAPPGEQSVCEQRENGTVFSHTGNYSECVTKWLFAVRHRTKPGTYSDPRESTKSFLASGSVPRCYMPPRAANMTGGGLCFPVRGEQLMRLGLPFTEFHTVDNSNVGRFVFVTGVSFSHFEESLDAIASVQKFMPNHKIVVYDLGLDEKQRYKMETYCGVSVNQFPSDNRLLYPKHVKNLRTFAFKPLIIMEALRHYPAVVWIDSSARLRQSLETFYPQIINSGGLFLFVAPPKRSVVHHTHPSVYRYLPTNLHQLRHTQIHMPDGYYSRSEGVFWGVLWWWALCALTEECINPCELKPCLKINGNNILQYIGCHRYDMAVINVLLANHHGYDNEVYGGKRANDVFEKLRKNTSLYDIKVCSEVQDR